MPAAWLLLRQPPTEPFYRPAGRTGRRGHSLGLALASATAQAHGSRLAITTNPNGWLTTTTNPNGGLTITTSASGGLAITASASAGLAGTAAL
ncbi:hypothetical protein [Kutzneria chonburiensis]|uniref:Uncharacterized protein n=1 Tax=Kutzneria chonburiensis TaxID=1483604 RepID=A0ABV6MMF1_9PSEU|nr:hypothetical protein [Kutzneria chonburiensis]